MIKNVTYNQEVSGVKLRPETNNLIKGLGIAQVKTKKNYNSLRVRSHVSNVLVFSGRSGIVPS